MVKGDSGDRPSWPRDPALGRQRYRRLIGAVSGQVAAACAEGIARFQKTGGQPSAGVKLLGRWTKADLCGGFDLLETDDPGKLTEFAYMWSDLMRLESRQSSTMSSWAQPCEV